MENNNIDHDSKVIVKAGIFFGVLTLLAFLGGVFVPIIFADKKEKNETTNNNANQKTSVEYDVNKVAGGGSYFAEKFVLIDKILYALPTENWKDVTTDFVYNDKKYVKIASDVDKVYLVTPGQAEIVSTYYTDTNKDAYYVSNIVDIDKKPATIKKIEGASNIVNIYDMNGYDTIDFVMLNSDNQIVSIDNDYIYFDKKNNIGTTKTVNGKVFELSNPEIAKEKYDDSLSMLSMTLKVDGKEVDSKAEYILSDAIATYDDVDLFRFKVCKDKKGNYMAGESCLK